MHTLGVIAHFEVRPGKETEAAAFFQAGQKIVEQQPATTGWFAYRLGPTSYGAFAAFMSEADREALLAGGGPKSSREHADLFAAPPTFEKVDIVASRPPRV